MPKSKTDNLFRSEISPIKPFEFNEHVADVFADMIQRSVPGYQLLLSMIGMIAEQYAKPDSTIYDLGCSLGAMTIAMRPWLNDKHCKIIAVDNSSAMIKRCRKNLERDRSLTPIDIICNDIRHIPINNASFVVLNYTLQFIPVEERQSVLENIYSGMLPGAALLLTEKIIEEDKQDRLHVTALHEQFKKQQGYNDLEISQKRSALENVLVPETIRTHIDRLNGVGFTNSIIWLKCLNFISILATRSE